MEGKKERVREKQKPSEGGMLHTACVKGICHEFKKIYDMSYTEGVKGFRE